jgi:5-methylcytosine-specific restriction endonuclease McrA
MARPSGEKTRCNGQWTEARFRSFIFSMLRQGTRRWAPISSTLQKAREDRGLYRCEDCKEIVPPTVKDGRKRVKNIFVDHIEPIVDPETGFVSWDEYIERMFCEEDNLQLLCKNCHDKKTADERAASVEARKNRKDLNV